jgi:hypothetical protein
MSICTIPPAGWSCSREPGHEGPCAARLSRPYDEYINRTIAEIDRLEDHGSMSRTELRSLLIDAWMDGLKYSLVMIESEKRSRDVQQN